MFRLFIPVSLLMGALFLAGCNAGGDDPPQQPPVGPRVTVTPVTAATTAVPGETILLLWRFDLADNWHLYWNGRNDSGFPPAVKMDLPPGWQSGPLLWPAPERHLTAGEILDHVYHGQLRLLQELTVPADAKPGQVVTIPTRLDWLVCKDECVPGKAELELTLTIAAVAEPTAEAAEVAAALAALPGPAPADGLDLIWNASSVAMVVPGSAGLEFYPATDCGLLVDLISDGVGQDGRLLLRFRAKDDRIGPLKGILHQQLPDGSKRNWILDAHPGG